jgi:hypothetical protein
MERIGTLDPGEVLEALSSMKDQLLDAAQQASERLELERRLREDPWLVLGLAAGAGFILGGGLWPALRPLVKAAGRAALSPSNLIAIAAAVGAMRATQGERGGAEEAPDTTPTPTAH